MTDRPTQLRLAQRKRRERLKESGTKSITLELTTDAQARLKQLSMEMFGESRPSAVVEHLLTASSTDADDEGENLDTTTEWPHNIDWEAFNAEAEENRKTMVGWLDHFGLDIKQWCDLRSIDELLKITQPVIVAEGKKPDRGKYEIQRVAEQNLIESFPGWHYEDESDMTMPSSETEMTTSTENANSAGLGNPPSIKREVCL